MTTGDLSKPPPAPPGSARGSAVRTVRRVDVAPQPWKNGGGVTRDLFVLAGVGGADACVRPAGSNVVSDRRRHRVADRTSHRVGEVAGDGARDGLGVPGWQLRISVAEIDRDGPFSAYPGVDRWFAVVEGTGVELGFGGVLHRLLPQHAPLDFDGAAAPSCRLLEGPTLDLNLLVQRAAGRGWMHMVRAGVGWQSAAPFRAVYTARPAGLHIDGVRVAGLAAHTLAWIDVGEATEAGAADGNSDSDHHDDGNVAADGDGGATWELRSPGEPSAWWLSFKPHPLRAAP